MLDINTNNMNFWLMRTVLDSTNMVTKIRAVLWIRDIMVRIWPINPDQDPTIFVLDLQESRRQEKTTFFQIFLFFTFWNYI